MLRRALPWADQSPHLTPCTTALCKTRSDHRRGNRRPRIAPHAPRAAFADNINDSRAAPRRSHRLQALSPMMLPPHMRRAGRRATRRSSDQWDPNPNPYPWFTPTFAGSRLAVRSPDQPKRRTGGRPPRAAGGDGRPRPAPRRGGGRGPGAAAGDAAPSRPRSRRRHVSCRDAPRELRARRRGRPSQRLRGAPRASPR